MKRIPLLLLSLSVLLFSRATINGQTFLPGKTPFQAFDGAFWPADFDGDGRMDVLALDSTTAWHPGVFINTGGTNGQWFARVPSPPMATHPDFRAVWRDENGDGLLDFLATAYNDFGELVTRLYVQSSDHTFSFVPIDIPGSPICWADLDNDGRLDIITVLSSPSEARIYWGEGNRKFTRDDTFVFYARGVQAADMDRDGDLDLLCQSNGLRAYRNDGRRVFTDMGAIAPANGDPASHLVDVNGDGRLDYYGNRFINDSLISFLCLAQGDFQMASNRITSANNPSAIVDAADLDGDGLPELLLGGYTDPIVPPSILTLTNGTYVNAPYTFPRANKTVDGTFADYDGDGDLDLMVAQFGTNTLLLNQTGAVAPPASPRDATVRITRERVFFSWAAGSEKPTSFNLRVGTKPGFGDVMDSCSLSNGQRQLPQMGNVQTATHWHIDGLKPGVYYWSVQSVDWGYHGSPFVPEMSFTITGLEEPEPAPTISMTTTNLVTDEDTAFQVPIAFGPESLVDTLAVTMTGGDPTLAVIGLSGSGTNRTLTVNPLTNRFGATQVIISAVATNGTTNRLMVGVTVKPVNDLPTISGVADFSAYVGDPPVTIPITISDVESDPTPPTSTLRLSARSSNERILPSSAVTVSRSTVTINVAWALEGSTVITLTADDGEGSTSQSFTLNLLPRPFRLTPSPGSFQSQDFKIADFDNDGLLDYVDEKAVYLNKPVGWVERFNVGQDGVSRIAVADFDGDNFVDILTVSASVVRLLHNQSGTNFEERAVGQIVGCTPMQIETADLDNDGDVDVIVTGTLGFGLLKTWVYLNTPSGFVEKQTGLPGFQRGCFAIHDLNGDGWLDFVFAGVDKDGADSKGLFWGSQNGFSGLNSSESTTVPVGFRGLVKLFNQVNQPSYYAWATSPIRSSIALFSFSGGRFVPAAAFTTPGSALIQGGWADLHNEAQLDFVGSVNGPHGNDYTVYRNGGFVSMPDPFRQANFNDGKIAFADVDDDGAIDVITTSAIWINQTSAPNFSPTAPIGLRGTHTDSSITLEWEQSSDFNQPRGLTYNVRVGTRPGASDILSAASLPSGKRLLPQAGNAGTRTGITITNLNGETYYWSVQAVDDIFAGSPFAEEHTIVLDRPGNLPPVVSISPSVRTSAEDSPGSLRVTVEDDRTYPEFIPVEVISLTPELISTSSIHVQSDGGAIRNVSYVPMTNAFGSGSLQIRATDAVGAMSSIDIPVTVTPVNDPPTIAAIAPQTIDSPFDPITIPIVVSDIDDAPESLTVSVHSDNQKLIPDGNIALVGAGTSRTLQLKPAVQPETGVVGLTVKVIDPSGASATTSFSVTVTNVLFKMEPVDFGPKGAMGWADINNDGRLDLAVSWFTTLIYTNGPERFSRLETVYPLAQSIDWGDYDRDGYIDLLLHGVSDGTNSPFGAPPYSTGDPGVYRNDHSAGFTLMTPKVKRTFGLGQLADMNNDGSLEIVLTGTLDGWTFQCEIYQEITNTLSRVKHISPVDGKAPMIEDFDGDGSLDLHFTKLVNADASLWEDRIYYQKNGNFIERPLPWGGQLLAWDDFNNDGKPDAVVYTTNSELRVFLQSNSGFTPLPPITTGAQIYAGHAFAGDYDADGRVDLLIDVDFNVVLFRNLGNGQFQRQDPPLLRTSFGAVQPADYNNDGRLDLLVSTQDRTLLYRNTLVPTNTPPQAPPNVRARNTSQGLMIEWDPASDANQSGGLTYNVAIGTVPGKWDIMNPMSAANGWRKIPKKGNAGWRQSKLVKGLETGRRVYFTVQAVDNSFAGSPFAPEQSIEVITPPQLAILSGSADSLTFSLSGMAGGAYEIQFSTDLQTWSLLWKWVATSNESRFTIPGIMQNVFIRAVGE